MLGSDALSQKDFKNAQIYFDQAISRNPNAPVSLASDSFAMFNIVLQGPQTNLTTKLSKPELLALRAVAINPNYSFAYALISRIEALKGNTDKAKKFAALVLSSIKRDDITPPADKTTLKNSFSTSTPGVSNIKIISAKKISAPPKGSSPADSSSTGITIVKKSSK
jgi:tetratricopeptide (TPR) repeat protein